MVNGHGECMGNVDSPVAAVNSTIKTDSFASLLDCSCEMACTLYVTVETVNTVLDMY